MADLFDDHDGQVDLKINKKYATAYEARKQKDELRRVQFEENDDDVSSSDESEDEDGELLTTRLDADIMKALNAVRGRDKRIYDPSVRFFSLEDDVDDSDDEEQEAKPKRKTYKDVVREQALEQMEQGDKGQVYSEDSNEDTGKRTKLAYDQEQQELRRAFAAADDDAESSSDDLLVVKSRGKATSDEDSDEARRLLETEMKQAEESIKNEPLDLVDPKGEVKDPNSFLFDYFKNRSWMEKTAERSDSDDDNPKSDDEQSLAQLEETDNFEAKYNFRFEEAVEANESGAAFSNISYARGLTVNTLRRKDGSRREKRLAKKERKEEERRAKEERLKRLKNAKRQELENKMRQIQEVVGGADDGAVDEATLLKLLEGDFYPDKFEKLMAQAYNEDYYNQQDPEWTKDTDVRKSLAADEDGELLVGQDDADGGLYDNTEDQEADGAEYDGDAGNYEEEEDWPEEEYEEEKPSGHLEQKLKAKVEDELYKLDYEDIVAGQPTRFKYRQVQANTYGLSTEEILFSRDSTLKQFVSLKKMAPYRDEEEFHVNAKKRRRFREQLKKDAEEQQVDDGGKVSESPVQKMETETRKKKRRRLKKNKDGSIARLAEPPAAAETTEPLSSDKPATIPDPENTASKKEKKKKKKDRKDRKKSSSERKFEGKDDKKKKRSRSSSKMDGITDARLASYGL